MKKGFTLIELLAVIVVLAIIALIAVPVVLNIIEKARKGAAISSARSYIKAVEAYIVSSELDKDKIALISNNKYNVTTTTTIDGKTYQSINNLVEVKGSLPIGSEDYIKMNEDNEVTEVLLTINGYIILIRYDEVVSITKGSIISVESITLDKTNASIEVGKTLQLNAIITPDNATNKTVTWTSSDESVATVDNKGLVTGIKVGNVIITATTSNGKIATASITVYKGELLSDKVSIGDYVAYDAGEWTSDAPMPTNSGQFGGYIKGSKANSVSCDSGTTTPKLSGWRVLSVDKDTNTVTIIHAGIPECYKIYARDCSSNERISNERATEYLNSNFASNAHMMNREEALAITGSGNSTTNNLITIGAQYHLADGVYGHYEYGHGYYMYFVSKEGMVSDTYEKSYISGIRPVIVLKPNIKTTGKTTDAVGQEAWSLAKP